MNGAPSFMVLRMVTRRSHYRTITTIYYVNTIAVKCLYSEIEVKTVLYEYMEKRNG